MIIPALVFVLTTVIAAIIHVGVSHYTEKALRDRGREQREARERLDEDRSNLVHNFYNEHQVEFERSRERIIQGLAEEEENNRLFIDAVEAPQQPKKEVKVKKVKKEELPEQDFLAFDINNSIEEISE